MSPSVTVMVLLMVIVILFISYSECRGKPPSGKLIGSNKNHIKSAVSHTLNA